jgi:hypothetical protein
MKSLEICFIFSYKCFKASLKPHYCSYLFINVYKASTKSLALPAEVPWASTEAGMC